MSGFPIACMYKRWRPADLSTILSGSGGGYSGIGSMTVDVLIFFDVAFLLLGSHIIVLLLEMMSIPTDRLGSVDLILTYLLLAIRQCLPLLASQLGGFGNLYVTEVFASKSVETKENV